MHCPNSVHRRPKAKYSRGFVNWLGRADIRRDEDVRPTQKWTFRDHYPDYSRVLPPLYLVHSHRLLEALRHELTAVREQEPLPAAQPAHRVRDQDLPT